ncbi:MAG TPA: serine/threonine protein kinase [Firmicutes bacterium]|nr:serine/threonine protein kinase [Candidatus Fermentithermobacillaceae bacterium]
MRERDEMIGRKLSNRYQIEERLGGGGMAVVWRAFDTVLGRNVAVKLLRQEMAEDEEFVARFRREAQAAARLSHPNIVAIYDVGEDYGLYYIVMELVEGMTLRQKLKQAGRLPVAQALDIAAQVASGLHEAHARGIIHRDIKPQNILITETGLVKVTDFGIARAVGGVSTTGDLVVGSLPYMSPEQVSNGEVSAATDIYSLGVVLFEMLVGRPPFQAESTVGMAMRHLEGEVPSIRQFRPDVPPAVEALVMKCLAKKPVDRFSSAKDLLRAIKMSFPVQAGTGEQMKPDGLQIEEAPLEGDEDLARKRRRPKRRMSLAVKIFLAAMVLFLGLVAAGIYAFNKWMEVPLVEVPNVEGKPFLEAQAILMEKGLVPVMAAERYDPQVPRGCVINQAPEAGDTVKQGREVRLVVSKGREMVKVPDLIGKDVREASVMLEESNLVLGNSVYVFHPAIPAGKVVSQNPKADIEVPKGTTVDIEVSKGPMPTTAIVPNVVGMTRDQAKDELEKALLTPKFLLLPGEQPAGTVMSQSHVPGTEVPVGTEIIVAVSLGTGPAPNVRTIPISVPKLDKDTVRVKVVLKDAQGERTVLEQDRKPGEQFELRVEWVGAEAQLNIYFDEKLVNTSTLRPETPSSEGR